MGLVAALVVVVSSLWRYPDAELVVFHAVWIGVVIVALRLPSERLRVWVLVLLVGALALATEIDDLRTHHEVGETLTSLALDVPAFVALMMLARRHTRLLKTEHDRRERQRAFFANAAHALRTPITIARGHIELVLAGISEPTQREDLNVALDELDRLTRAADRNLRLSIVGELDPQQFTPVDPAALVQSIVERWKPTVSRDFVAISQGRSGVVVADAEQLTEALDALVENAVHATGPGDRITVSTEGGTDSVVLCVSDTGHGVDAADRQRLFEPFERGPHERGDSAGTGLGLAVVRAIAVAHGGRAEMESVGSGGTAVRMVLPRRPRQR